MNITTIKQIELTTKCNLACRYCPHPKMQRTKEHMSSGTFHKALKWIEYFTEQGTQGEVSLTGVGEPLMHPHILILIEYLRAVHKGDLLFSTNGILMTEEIGEWLKAYNVQVYVSTHRPERAAPAVNICKKLGILAGVNTSFVTSSLDWAGQVDWEVSAPLTPCAYLHEGWGVVLADGRISTCCLDAEALGVISHVGRKPGPVEIKPFVLCDTCHMTVPEEEAVA